MSYTRQFRDGKRVASTIYLRERKDKAASKIAKREKRSKSAVLVKIVEDHLP